MHSNAIFATTYYGAGGKRWIMVDVDYITALVNCRQIAANCRYVTRGLYITSSGATTLLLSFL